MSCLKQYDYVGYKTYSDSVPPSANGCHFPGDEPGVRCRITCEPCCDLDGREPGECGAPKRTAWRCPDCAQLGKETTLEESGHGVLFCPACKKSWPSLSQLAGDYNAYADYALDALSYYDSRMNELRDEIDDLERERDGQKAEIGELKHVFAKLASLLPAEILKDELSSRAIL